MAGVANLLSRFNNQIMVARSDMGVQDREAWLMSLQRAVQWRAGGLWVWGTRACGWVWGKPSGDWWNGTPNSTG